MAVAPTIFGFNSRRTENSCGSRLLYREYLSSSTFTHRKQLQWRITNDLRSSSCNLLCFSISSHQPLLPAASSPTDPIDASISNTNQIDNCHVETTVPTPRSLEEDELVLYERDVYHPDAIQTTTMMRSGFIFSSFHTLYWFWYTIDFIPHVNKATMEVLHIDPMIGVAGIFFAMALQSAFTIYPCRLISKLVYRIDERRILIYTHRIPSMYPSWRRPYTSFPLGTPNTAHNTATVHKQQLLKATSKEDIQSLHEKAKATAGKANKQNVTYFTLDATTPTALDLIQGESQGDLSKYRGHLVLGPRWPKYILDIKDSDEVKESAILLQALLKPEHFYYKGAKNYNSSIDYDSQSVVDGSFQRKQNAATPFQIRTKSRGHRASKPKPKKRR